MGGVVLRILRAKAIGVRENHQPGCREVLAPHLLGRVRDARRARAREMFARVAGFPTVKTVPCRG
jgi:hypothetical protein